MSESIIDGIIHREGGFVNHPADRGGPTNWGITQAKLSEWRRKPVTVDDVRNLTEGEARQIYRHEYIVGPGFANITDEPLRELVVDCGVNHGTRRASQWLQSVAGVHTDGIVGPKTLHAVNFGNSKLLYRKLLAMRCRFFGRLISNDHSQAVFAAGWLNHRVAEFIERCQ